MNNKFIMIVSAITIVALAAIVVMLQNNKKDDQVDQQASEQKRECGMVPEDAKDVEVSLIKNQNTTGKLFEYRVSLESKYPVNVAGIAFSFDPKNIKFVSASFDSSAFSVQAPTDTLPTGLKFNRGIAGAGAGLVGGGEFGTFTFEKLVDGGGSEPVIDVEHSDAFLNNGCAEKAKILIQ